MTTTEKNFAHRTKTKRVKHMTGDVAAYSKWEAIHVCAHFISFQNVIIMSQKKFRWNFHWWNRENVFKKLFCCDLSCCWVGQTQFEKKWNVVALLWTPTIIEVDKQRSECLRYPFTKYFHSTFFISLKIDFTVNYNGVIKYFMNFKGWHCYLCVLIKVKIS